MFNEDCTFEESFSDIDGSVDENYAYVNYIRDFIDTITVKEQLSDTSYLLTLEEFYAE